MLAKGGIAPFICAPLLVLFFIFWRAHHEPSSWNTFKGTISTSPFSPSEPGVGSGQVSQQKGDSPQVVLPGEPTNVSPEHLPHRELVSLSTADGNYFPIVFGDKGAINPSILAHPQLEDVYIIVAQQQRSEINNTVWFAQLVCNANFTNGVLGCMESPTILPISATYGDKCKDELVFFNFNIGPHDGRAFYGPNGSYVLFGSNSHYTCFGQWMQDLRVLTDWGIEWRGDDFRSAVELRRHKPYGRVEKNWFVFWDKDGEMYVHWDIQPKRSFAKLRADGTVGKDLAKYAKSDKKCMAKYMPRTGPKMEDNHQATNSLSITTCKRSDPNCKSDDSNTFIINIFHFKSYHFFHGVYEPYVMLFQQHSPLAIHAIGSKPLWIKGRKEAGKGRMPDVYNEQAFGPWNQTEMVYVTSISWKAHGSRYHGYADDIMFLGFGIEDQTTGGIDIVAGDLLADLNLCKTPPKSKPKGIGYITYG
ncbi:hypothetical protein BKA65DRAFT_290630 [Rhexocercosporidium sp. MPI-PUGE-AT-0058]|nr:hypothetical protein BKA65DRAFT_290630 [Rhexocercosporidium sp. MPI-PUGE-AT-0058]